MEFGWPWWTGGLPLISALICSVAALVVLVVPGSTLALPFSVAQLGDVLVHFPSARITGLMGAQRHTPPGNYLAYA